MKLSCKTATPLLFATMGLLGVSFAFQVAQIASAEEKTTANVDSREEILDSLQWAKAKQQFDAWIVIQKAYNDTEIEAIKSEFRNRIDTMNAVELQLFLEEMEAKIAVLMSPATRDARRWVAMYTDKKQDEVAKRYGVEDPIRLPAAQIEAALSEIAAARQSKLAASTAFQQSRSAQAKAVGNLKKQQAQAIRKSATARAPSRSSYAPYNKPPKPKTYSAAYPKLQYSISPWGGVWVGPRR